MLYKFLFLRDNTTINKDLYITFIMILNMENKNRETTSIKIDKELWKEAKKYCIDKNITISELIEKLLEKEIRNRGLK